MLTVYAFGHFRPIFVDHLFLWPSELEVSVVIVGRHGKQDLATWIDDRTRQ